MAGLEPLLSLKGVFYLISKKMEQKSPGIYILEPLTEAKGLDFEIKSKRTLENNLGPCGEQGTRTPFTPTSTGNLTFVSGLIEKTERY